MMKYKVPHDQISRVNSIVGKQGGIPEKKVSGIKNSKGDPSWSQTELITRCQRENCNKDPSCRQKESIPRLKKNQRGIPKREY